MPLLELQQAINGRQVASATVALTCLQRARNLEKKIDENGVREMEDVKELISFRTDNTGFKVIQVA